MQACQCAGSEMNLHTTLLLGCAVLSAGTQAIAQEEQGAAAALDSTFSDMPKTHAV